MSAEPDSRVRVILCWSAFSSYVIAAVNSKEWSVTLNSCTQLVDKAQNRKASICNVFLLIPFMILLIYFVIYLDARVVKIAPAGYASYVTQVYCSSLEIDTFDDCKGKLHCSLY